MKTITYNPETHVLVPRAPTRFMVALGWDSAVEHGADNIDINDTAAIYRAMIAAAPQPEPVDVDPMAMLPFAILDDELADLRRFTDCADDGEGYDVPKNRMKRLAEIGLLRHVSAGYYEHTVFGLSVLNGDFTTPNPDRTAELEAALKVAKAGIEWALSNINCEPFEWSDEENADAHREAIETLAKINEVLHD